MFNIKNIVNKITDRGRESNPNSPGRASQEDDGLSLKAEGFLCPKCMKAFASPSELHAHYESLHADESSADAARFPFLRPEVSERHRHGQDGTAAPGSIIKSEEVSSVTDVGELQRMLLQVLEGREALQTEKDHLEQRAAQLAQLNVTLKAACDEGESNQTALKERLKVVEAQLAHRESIDDAAVLRQELVQVQRVMDELNREREQERDALRAELQTLQRDGRQETIAEMKETLHEKELEIVNLTLALDAAQKQTLEEESKNSNVDVEVLKERLEQLTSLMGKSERQVETLKSELDKIVKERDALKKALSDAQQKSDDLEVLTALCEDKDSKLLEMQEEANDLKTELFQKVQLIRDLERSKTSCEEGIAQCREKISKMEMERSELVAQIEVGEGATTAIQQLTEENTCLQVKLKEEREQHHKTREAAFREMEDTGKQLAEIHKKKDTLESHVEKLKTSVARLEEENAKAERQLSENAAEKGVLSATITGLQLEVNNYRRDLKELSEIREQLAATQHEVVELQDALGKKEGECQHLKAENDQLVEEISTLSDRLKSTENQLQVIGVQRASLETSLFEVQKAMAEVESEKKDLEEERTGLKEMVKTKTEALTKGEQAVAILMAERVALTQEVEALQERYEDVKSRCEQLEMELTACKDAKEDMVRNLADEAKKRVQMEEEVERLRGTLQSREKELAAKQKSLQTSLDEVTGEKIALDMQLEASQAERQALLERCYASTSEAETLHTTIADLHRKLDESQAALHELGRENQTLQLDIDKLIGRKWAEDSEVYQCTLCHRDFSLIMRKHHCRNCGQIFCAECSSKTAPIASNKKPVRVCDSCYSELAPK